MWQKMRQIGSGGGTEILNPLIPNMTSNTTPSGLAFAETEYESLAYQAFDGNTSTCWRSRPTSSPTYIGYKFDTPKCVKKVEFRELWDGFNNTNLISFLYVEGSNDNVEWSEPIARIPLDTNLSKINQEFKCENDEKYLYYRLRIMTPNYRTSNNSYGTMTNIQMYGY